MVVALDVGEVDDGTEEEEEEDDDVDGCCCGCNRVWACWGVICRTASSVYPCT